MTFFARKKSPSSFFSCHYLWCSSRRPASSVSSYAVVVSSISNFSLTFDKWSLVSRGKSHFPPLHVNDFFSRRSSYRSSSGNVLGRTFPFPRHFTDSNAIRRPLGDHTNSDETRRWNDGDKTKQIFHGSCFLQKFPVIIDFVFVRTWIIHENRRTAFDTVGADLRSTPADIKAQPDWKSCIAQQHNCPFVYIVELWHWATAKWKEKINSGVVLLLFCVAFVSAELMFLETSALTGENVEETFLKCARSILTKIESGAVFRTSHLQDKIQIFCEARQRKLGCGSCKLLC